MDTQLTYLILIPWRACKTKTNPKIQLHKAINHWKNVGKPLKSFRRQLKVIELVRDSCGWHNLPPGWDKVNWVGEKQQQYCVSPAQLRPRDGGSQVILARIFKITRYDFTSFFFCLIFQVLGYVNLTKNNCATIANKAARQIFFQINGAMISRLTPI